MNAGRVGGSSSSESDDESSAPPSRASTARRSALAFFLVSYRATALCRSITSASISRSVTSLSSKSIRVATPRAASTALSAGLAEAPSTAAAGTGGGGSCLRIDKRLLASASTLALWRACTETILAVAAFVGAAAWLHLVAKSRSCLMSASRRMIRSEASLVSAGGAEGVAARTSSRGERRGGG